MKNNKLATNTILLTLGTFLNKGLLFLMIPLFSRWLTAEEYGYFDLICTYIALLVPIISLSIDQAIFRFCIGTKNFNEKKIYITNALFLVFINIIISIIILSCLIQFLNSNLLIPFILLLIGEIINNYLQGFLRGISKLGLYSLFSAITTIFVAIFVTLFILRYKLALTGILLGYACGYFISCLIIVISTKFWRYIDFGLLSFSITKKMVKYSYSLIPNSISWWIMNTSDRQIINLFLGLTANGIFSIAHKVPSLCSSIFSMFSISWQESASEFISEKDNKIYFNKIYNKMIKILISLCICLLSINFLLFNYIFDIKYYEASLYTPFLISSLIFSSLSQFYGGIQISLMRPKENGITTVIGALVNIFIHLLLIKLIGLYAAAISTLISNIVVMYLRQRKISKIIKIQIDSINYAYIIIYLYFFISTYYRKSMILDLANILLAIIILIYTNKKYIIYFIQKSFSFIHFLSNKEVIR